MNRNRFYLWGTVAAVITAGLFLGAMFFKTHSIDLLSSRHTAQAQNHKIDTAPLSADESKIVKPADRAQIEIPQSAIARGKVMHVPILMYHHVGIAPATADATHKGLTVSPEEFEAQVKWLKDHNYTSVSLDQLYKHIKNPLTDWPAKPVVFTFDDGYEDVFANAVPILQKYNYTGSFAIITSFPGQTQADNIYAPWSDIISAKQKGMEIVCHTRNHFDGSSAKFDSKFILDNLSGCQQDLKQEIGSPLPYLIYPYGHFTPMYIDQALKTGFVMGLTVHEGSFINTEDLMHIPRVRVNPGETMAKFIEKINS